MPVTINNITFVALYECLYDEGNIEQYGISPEEWKQIRKDWEEQNPTETEEFELQKQIFANSIRLNKHRLEQIIAQLDPESSKQTPEDLKKAIAKHEALVEIQVARLGKMLPKEGEAPKANLEHLYECIASLEPHGFNIPDYNELLYSKYRAITKTIENGRENKRK